MKAIIISIIIAIAIIVGAGFLAKKDSSNGGPAENNVSIVDGKQIIELQAKGGYQPRISTAQSGISTILRFNTRGTFDCSSAVRIPSMNISKTLPPSGVIDIDLGIPESGTLDGSCGMGMYPFAIQFKE